MYKMSADHMGESGNGCEFTSAGDVGEFTSGVNPITGSDEEIERALDTWLKTIGKCFNTCNVLNYSHIIVREVILKMDMQVNVEIKIMLL